jgi:hypothetical protein
MYTLYSIYRTETGKKGKIDGIHTEEDCNKRRGLEELVQHPEVDGLYLILHLEQPQILGCALPSQILQLSSQLSHSRSVFLSLAL